MNSFWTLLLALVFGFAAFHLYCGRHIRRRYQGMLYLPLFVISCYMFYPLLQSERTASSPPACTDVDILSLYGDEIMEKRVSAVNVYIYPTDNLKENGTRECVVRISAITLKPNAAPFNTTYRYNITKDDQVEGHYFVESMGALPNRKI